MEQYQIKKRNGDLEMFELAKIKSAIKRTFDSCDRNYQDSIIELLAIKSIANAETKVKDSVLSVEDIQDSVESTLMSLGYEDVAKSYILYRKQHEKARKAKETVLDYKKTINSYINVEDWRVKENSTVIYSLGGLILNNSGTVTANYWLSEIYDDEIANAHRNCDIHIHDLSMLSGYCAGWSLKQLIKEGLGGVPGKITSGPASHLSTLCNQMVNFIGCFTDDTRIILSNGTKPTIREMLDSGETEWVVKSYDPKTNKVIDSKFDNLHKTRTVEEYIEIEFDDGDIVKCTTDHKFYTYNRGWVEAKDLTEEDDIANLEYNKYIECTSIKLVSKKVIKETKDVYCGTVHNDFHGFFINDGKLVHNCLQNEWAGAQAFSSVDTYLAAFVKAENLPYKEVKQSIQSLIFGLNTPSRWGCQAPFSNFTFDWTVPDDLAELNCIVGGKEVDFKYKDCKREMDMVNKAFMEIMMEGDWNGRGFQYPIPTYSITKDFDWDEGIPNNKLLFEMTAKYGIPYFSNYVNSDMSPNDIRSMCVLPDTMVWVRFNGKTRHITIKELYDTCDNYDSVKILSKHGYRDIKEAQRFEYSGRMLRITTKSGKVLTITPDHRQVVFDTPDEMWYEKDGFKRLFTKGEDKTDWELVDNRFNKSYGLIKKYGYELKVGDYLSCRNPNAGELRKGMTYEDYFGKDRAEKIKNKFSEDRKGKTPWNKGISTPDSVREKISSTLKGHPVTDFCRQKSSERWLGDNNPKHKCGSFHEGRINCTVSNYEYEFAKELDSLGIEYVHQYVINNEGRDYVPDFYIPSKNMIIELETNYRYSECSYNDFHRIFDDSRERYETFVKMGYNVLVFNPKKDSSSYRQYINSVDEIVSIEDILYEGYVYDVEVNCDDVEESLKDIYHTFYANEILTGNCCRLRLDLRELRRKSGGYFGSGENTGSIGVVTINMPRLAYNSKTKEEFYKRLVKLMDISARSLKVKRNVITQLLEQEQSLYPYTKRYLGKFDNHFSTIGLVGMNECCLNANWVKKDISSKEGYEFTKEVLDFMRNKLSDYQEEYGDLYNLEATPAESTAFRFALHDKKDFPNIITAGDETEGSPYYTNSSHLPVSYTEDIFSALDIQDDLQTRYTSGTVFHAFLGEKLPSWQSAMNLTRKIAENYKLPYFTFSPTYSICKEHGYIKGEEWTCPECGKPTEVYSRVTGYYRAVQNFNDGKQHEFKDRKEYVVNDIDFNQSDITGAEECESCKVGYTEIPETREEVTTEQTVRKILAGVRKPMLFTTSTCPNCKMAKKFITDAGFDCDILLAEENVELTKLYNINQAPTLVVFNDGEPQTISNVSNIRKYLESLN